MDKILLTLILIFSASHLAYSKSFFSHTVLNLPYEYQTEEPWIKVINSNEEWQSFYQELKPPDDSEVIAISPSRSAESEVIPEIDFEVFTLVVGGLGFQSSSSTRLSIDRTIELPDEIYVSAISVSAGAGCVVAWEISYPTIAFLIEKTEKEITTYLKAAVSDCD